jgi:thiamine biosynthesis lipoprotein
MPSFAFAFSTMGCPAALHVEAEAPELAHAALAAVRTECDRLERKYSHYRDDSLLAQIARAAGTFVEVDAETAGLLDFAAALHEQSEGAFDVTIEPLSRLWGTTRRQLPSATEIAAVQRICGWRHLRWRSPWLQLDLPGMRLNLGGLVKEYAADRCAQLCRDIGLRAGVVDLGGDLALVGPHLDGSAWRVGIRSPRTTQRASATIGLPRGGLATSGDYERAVVIHGRRYSHIVDPRSGWPVRGFASVSVVADSCLVAGAAATLAMLLGTTRGLGYLRRLGLPHLCIDQAGGIRGSVVGAVTCNTAGQCGESVQAE